MTGASSYQDAWAKAIDPRSGGLSAEGAGLARRWTACGSCVVLGVAGTRMLALGLTTCAHGAALMLGSRD